VLTFAYRYLPKVAPWLLFPILLMCVGAVYDGYHYASDVVGGAIVGILVALVFWRKGAENENPLRRERA
jgi:membrane-associated phospholipid phosphatase